MARRHRLAIELALLALIAYLAALGVSAALRAHLAEPVAAGAHEEPATVDETAAPPPLAAYAVIAERDIFNPRRDAARPDVSEALRLSGVAFHGGEARAVIEDPATRRQELYRVGDLVGAARLAAVDWDRVTLAHPAGEATLELLPPPPARGTTAAPPATAEGTAGAGDRAAAGRIRRTGENAFVVDRREIVGALDNTSALLTDLRAVAEVRDGRPAGFRLFRIRDDSLFARLGLRNGDVVQRVNGSAVADPAALLAFLERLRREPRVALDIVRGEAPRTLVYDLR